MNLYIYMNKVVFFTTKSFFLESSTFVGIFESSDEHNSNKKNQKLGFSEGRQMKRESEEEGDKEDEEDEWTLRGIPASLGMQPSLDGISQQ